MENNEMEVTRLITDPAINDLVVRITTAAVMCLDADEDSTARMAAFERGIVQDIDRFRTTALAAKEAENAELRAKVERLREALRRLVKSVDDLIAESDGVYGLHLNGDPSPWGELTQGGRFEDWLIALEHARAALSKGPTQ